MKKWISVLLCLILLVSAVSAAANAVILGDIDGNGTVNNQDLALLQQYVNEWDVTLSGDGDVNEDDHINNRDLVTLQRYINGWDVGLPTICTIAEARNVAQGDVMMISGVVARITYANGMKPSGVMLVDETGSIYVYDSDIASACTIGNTITVQGTKDYWVLETEADNAAKFGYEGCNQITDATLLYNDGQVSDFDTAAIPETTVKAIMDTPVTEDITTTVYKVNALVKKAPGNGFVNYYINDLDGTTGSYVYTQCNGSDFGWLDEFDGKICTVYVTPINAKSSSAGCVWRFLPIAVKYENFDVSTVNIPEHVVEYYGLPQFLTAYTGDPAQELVTSVSGDLLGYENAPLTYSSANTAVATVEDGVLHCLSTGTATITVSCTYGGVTYAADVTIAVTVSQQGETYPTVADAIAANVGDAVTVKGIVGPSLVNKVGFYLIDESGVIAVETTAATMELIEIGHEVVIEATRGLNTKNKDYGQTCLKDAAVVVNNYGSHAYPTDAFKGDITVADFYALDVNTDVTTHVYTMKATVQLEETAYYTNLKLTDGTTTVSLYCSSAAQYNWLKAFAGEEITVEIAPCNWNSKTYYTGCVLSVIHEDGTKTYNTLNFDN